MHGATRDVLQEDFLFPSPFCCSWLSSLRLCQQAMTLQGTKTSTVAPK
jgi:hypothetical protein